MSKANSSFNTAWRTLQGYEATNQTNQLRKGQIKGTTRGDILSQVRFVSLAWHLGWSPSLFPITI